MLKPKIVNRLGLALAIFACASALSACAEDPAGEQAEHTSSAHMFRLSPSDYQAAERVSDSVRTLYSTASSACQESARDECGEIAALARQGSARAQLSLQSEVDEDGTVAVLTSSYDTFVLDLGNAVAVAGAVEAFGDEAPESLVEASDELISSLTAYADLARRTDSALAVQQDKSCPWYKKAACAVPFASAAPNCASIAAADAAAGENYQQVYQSCMMHLLGNCYRCF